MFAKGFSATESVLPQNALLKRASSTEAQVSSSATALASTSTSIATSTSPEPGVCEKVLLADTGQPQEARAAAEGRGRNRAQTDSTTRSNKSHSPVNRGQAHAAAQSRALPRSVSPPRAGTAPSARAARQKNQKMSSAWTAADAREAGGEVSAGAPAAASGARRDSEGGLAGQGIDGRPKSPTRPLSPVRCSCYSQSICRCASALESVLPCHVCA